MIEVNLDVKPIPVPLAYQPIYKIIILLAILRYGCDRPNKATFLKLHLYMWGLRSTRNLAVLRKIAMGKRYNVPPWSYEPGLERVVTLTVINKYCTKEIRNSELQIQISPTGISLLTKVEAEQYFKTDIDKIKRIGSIAQNRLAAANNNWTTK